MQQRRIAFRRQQRLAHRALRKSALFIPLLFIFFLQSRSLGVLTAARDAVLAPAARPAVRTAAPAERCADRDPQCAGWARKGRCDLEPYIMYDKCSRSCGVCPPPYLRQVPDDVVLPGNVTMPRVGFGTAGLGNATAAVVGAAIRAGFRKIDTAEAKEWYREDLVGRALSASPTPPLEPLFLTTKVHPRDFGTGSTRRAVNRSLSNLGVSVLDLVLLHYAECWGDLCEGSKPEGTWKEAWAALEQLVDEGVIRALGVSNFSPELLAELAGWARVRPALVQANCEPLQPSTALQAQARRLGIQFEGYSTLGGQYARGEGEPNPVLAHPVVVGISKASGLTPAQVVLRWALQNGQTVVPRTRKAEHMRENLLVTKSVPLTDYEMGQLAELGWAQRGGGGGDGRRRGAR